MLSKEGTLQNNLRLLCIGGLGVGKHSFTKCYLRVKDPGVSPLYMTTLARHSQADSTSVKLDKRFSTMGALPLLGLTSTESSSLPEIKEAPKSRRGTLKLRDKMTLRKNTTSMDLRGIKKQEIEFLYHTVTFRCEGLEKQLNQAHGILFIFSMTDLDSFADIKSVIKLCDQLQAEGAQERPFRVLVGTKCDQSGCNVTTEMVKELAMQVNIPYFITSSVSREGIKAIIDYVDYQMGCMESLSANLSSIISKDKFLTAAGTGNIAKVIEFLESGSIPSQSIPYGWAPIHIACWEGQLFAVIIMVQFEPHCVNAVNDLGWTPLHCAARCGHFEITEFLLDRGANAFVLDNHKRTALVTSAVRIKERIQAHIDSRNKYCPSSRQRKTMGIENIFLNFSAQETTLNLSFANVFTFPELRALKNLTEISFQSNHITEIPEDISVLENLEVLRLFENQIEFIPESVSTLSNLRILDVRCNQLTSIHSSIGTMKSLRELLLGHNKLAYLPSQLAELKNTLEQLDIFGNPLTTLTVDVIPKLGQLRVRDNTPLFTYLSNHAMGEEEYNHVKLMFVGESNVGKTSLINGIVSLTQENVPKTKKRKDKEFTDTVATDGIDIHSINIPLNEGKSMTWDCWDCAGQDIYYSTHQFFLSSRSMYVVCWNLLDQNFAKIDYWLNLIHSRARGSPIFLIGTHFDEDVVSSEYVDQVIQKLFSSVKPERFKSKLGVKSLRGVYTVGTRKNIGIHELIEGIKQEVQKCKYVGKLYPASWIKLNNTLSVLRQQKTKHLISFSELERIAVGCGIEISSVKDVVRFLHQSGVICYFEQGSAQLQQHVILDPQFLTRVMSSIVTARRRGPEKSSPGILSCEDLSYVFSKFPQELHESLMTLLEQFEIAFMIPKISSFIIPSLLPENQPDIREHWQVFINKETEGRVLGRTYKFEFLPLGFFSRLFIRNYHLPKFTVVAKWRNGQILKYKNVTALFRYNPTTFILRIEVHNPKAKLIVKEYPKLIKVFRLLLENIDTTIEGWCETNITVTIPCSHCLLAGGYSHWEFSMQECMKNISEGKGYVLCRNVRKIRLDFLAPDLSFADLQKKIIPSNQLEIGRVIGVGAFGTVMKGALNGHPVAIKQLNLTQETVESENLDSVTDSNNDMGDKYAEFQREVWIMSCLNHQCVCGLIGLTMNPMAIVMDYLPNGDLYHFIENIEKHSTSTKELLQSFSYKILLAYDIARGVEHLHGYDPPIIHRDLRSPNIFVAKLSIDADCRAKVGDFGLSRVVAPTLAGGEFNANWLAPEVMKGSQYNGKIDVYSFGIIMWEIVTLCKPFEEYDHKFAGKPKDIFKEAVIEGLRPTVPRQFDKDYIELMKQCWDDNPEKRPEFSQIVSRLEVIMLNKGVPFTSDAVGMDNASITVSNTPDDMMSSGMMQMEAAVTFHKRLEPKHPHTILAMSETHNQNGDFVISATAAGQIFLWNSKTFENVKQINMAKKRVYAVHGTEDVIWAGCDDGSIVGYTAKDFRKCCEVKESGAPVKVIIQYALIAISKIRGRKKPRQFLCTGDADGYLYSWKVKKYKLELKGKQKVAAHIGSIMLYNNYLCVGTERDILLVDKQNLSVIRKWSGHKQVINGLVKYGKEIWSASSDSTIRVWSEKSDECLHSLTGHSAKVLSLTRTSRYIWSGSFDKTILLWDPNTKFVVQELSSEHSDAIRSLYSQNEFVWSGGAELDAHICVWRHVE